MTVATQPISAARSPLRSVALPNEHGGWGLTIEPVVLGLLLAPSIAGGFIGVAAVVTFLARTPVKLISIDVRHRRWTDRSRLAARVALLELAAIVSLAAAAVWRSGWSWVVPVLIAAPLVGVEWWYDSRGRGRRLVPELAGAIGIAAVAAAVVVGGGGATSLAAGAWIVLAARATGSIPFVRVQIGRLRRGAGRASDSDRWQVAAISLASLAVIVDGRMVGGLVGVVVLAALQWRWVRRPPVPPKRLGFTQLVLGLGLVVSTAVGAALV